MPLLVKRLTAEPLAFRINSLLLSIDSADEEDVRPCIVGSPGCKPLVLRVSAENRDKCVDS